jgi:hypothetical protein
MEESRFQKFSTNEKFGSRTEKTFKEIIIAVEPEDFVLETKISVLESKNFVPESKNFGKRKGSF